MPATGALPEGWSGRAVEQQPSPQGYAIRIHTGNQRAEDVQINLWNGQLLIRSGAARSSARCPAPP